MVVALMGVAFFVAGWWAAKLEGRENVGWLRRELAVANDRLHAAWKDGAVIPPRPSEPLPPPPALPPALQEVVDEWEDPSVRADVEARLRHLHFEQKLGVQACILEIDRPQA